ncbi:flagellar hook-length control protein FliK [Alphaproteobacteria bacterium]|nr:flagellar hook-length control protein FliK [Alphaproteobacteria bacterium]
MNIITDINTTIEPFSGLKGTDEESSILSSLFSINVNSEEIVSEKDLIDKEFCFEDDDVKIIEYISNIISDFETKKTSLPNVSQIENKIKLDTSLSDTEKNKILNLIKLGLTTSKEVKLEMSFNKNFENLLTKKPLKSFDTKLENIKPVNNEKNITNLNKFKNINDVNLNQSKINNTDQEKLVNILPKQQSHKNKKLSLNYQHSSFVKKIKKNNHPNKIYDLTKVSKVEQNQLSNVSSQLSIKPKNNVLLNHLNSHIIETHQKNKINETKINNNQNININQVNQINTSNNYSFNGNTSFSNSGYNSVLENFLDNLDLTQKGWTSKLVSRIENSLADGGGEIEFNLKPKNLGMLKVSVTLKKGIGSVKIVTENSFATTALTQNETYLQKLFNDQGINLDFSAKNENQNFGSQNHFNQNSHNKNKNQHLTTEKKIEVIDENNAEQNSSRHIINVIA